MEKIDKKDKFGENGFNKKGIHRNGTNYDDDGYDKDGIHRDDTRLDYYGYDKDGFNKIGRAHV